ncbi:hypothetical protein DFH08DRAFT_807542 [Mycena albidolilacea]|uniref:Uncharacterized protein n=1 Tax=Mycena albidolilacea TaxID=1033008 RepID=A0AAD7A3Q2_9AGAR|nr:hypothetical protein DFH08DRAFT_807542 [Mycena albidolilacea]
MALKTLSFRGIDAWLQDRNGTRIDLKLEPAVQAGNQITAVVKVENAQKGYSVEWCTSQDAPAINALCEVFRPTAKSGQIKNCRIAGDYMSENDGQTQSRSSKGRLELPGIARDAWLRAPSIGTGDLSISFVTLEIRRLRETPQETENTNKSSELVANNIDLLDKEEEAYIIFRFEFHKTLWIMAFMSSISAIGSLSSSRTSGPKTLERPTLSTTAPRVRPSELSESSGSESEGPPLASVLAAKRKKHIQPDVDTTLNTRPGPLSTDGVPRLLSERHVDLLVGKRNSKRFESNKFTA